MNEGDRMLLRVLSVLNESQSRWYVAREAIALGRGGLKEMNRLTGMSRPTIIRGMRELREGRLVPTERVRLAGGGRKRVEESSPGFESSLKGIMEENASGDPTSLLLWTNKSTARIADEMTRLGYPTSDETIRVKLREMGYSLQANFKTKEELSPPERDKQFRYINRLVKRFTSHGNPILSIDTKKKERIGEFKNQGRVWRPKGKPEEVNMYDFPQLGAGTAIPYGAYDIGKNEGLVNVGVSHDTAEFAVESVRRWWRTFGRMSYHKADSLLLCADSGGSNGYRNNAWKYYLQRLSDEIGLDIMICHYPPGTSKWNKIEHRMFSFISMNWKGKPLVSYETAISLIGATRTRSGLRVKAVLDTKTYELGVKIPDEEMKRLNLRFHSVNPDWNYTISPRAGKQK
ncbi:MAG: ISAzo13 family transposase [Nitrososphaerota archaeon]|nr:ISAzo13 family transposase [Nitrososphaerota archaeon]